MADWYYMLNGQQTGPVTGTQLKSLAATGSLGPEDLVWNESMKDWVAAGRVRGLTFARTVAAPAPVQIQQISAPAYAPQPAPVEEYAPAPQEAPAQYEAPAAYEAPIQQAPQTLNYAGSGGQDVSQNTVKYLKQTRPWVMLISILMFLAVAGLAVGAVGGLIAAVAGGAVMSRSAASIPTSVGPGPSGGMVVTSGSSSAVPVAAGASMVGLGLIFAIVMFVYAAFLFFPALFLMKYARAIGRLASSRQTKDLEAAMKAQKSYWMFMGIVTLIGIGLYVVTFAITIMGAFH